MVLSRCIWMWNHEGMPRSQFRRSYGLCARLLIPMNKPESPVEDVGFLISRHFRCIKAKLPKKDVVIHSVGTRDGPFIFRNGPKLPELCFRGLDPVENGHLWRRDISENMVNATVVDPSNCIRDQISCDLWPNISVGIITTESR